VEIWALFRSLRHKWDPLDREILERTFDAALAAVKGNDAPIDSDEGLEVLLRLELIEVAYYNGVSDPETLRDILLARLPQRFQSARVAQHSWRVRLSPLKADSGLRSCRFNF
jgi:hypothetical protein